MDERSDFTPDDQSTSLLVDRRKHVRVRVHISGSVMDYTSTWHRCVIDDLSTGGARLQTQGVALIDAARVAVRFRLGPEYLLPATVVWSRRESKVNVAGIEWICLSDGEYEGLKSAIMRIAVNRRRARGPL